MDKQNGMYSYNGILFSLKKEGKPVTYYSVGICLEDILPGEMSWSWRDKYCMVPCI